MIFDTRWKGTTGIGRMTSEIESLVFRDRKYTSPSWPKSPLSPAEPCVRAAQLSISPRQVFYSPGFNAPLGSYDRTVFTVCDLIHLRVPSESDPFKRFYYKNIVKPAVNKCFKVLTISEYSRQDIITWSGANPSSILNIGCGVDDMFFKKTCKWSPGFPYLLYVGARKPHKNLGRLLTAYSVSRARSEVSLVLSGIPDQFINRLASKLGITDRLVFAGRIPDSELASFYQGAESLLFPSYFEGFGLPPIEAMAGGTPVLTSTSSSLPEVVGDAALTVDPFSIDALRAGIDQIVFDTTLRQRLQIEGPIQAQKHTWKNVAAKVSTILDALTESVHR